MACHDASQNLLEEEGRWVRALQRKNKIEHETIQQLSPVTGGKAKVQTGKTAYPILLDQSPSATVSYRMAIDEELRNAMVDEVLSMSVRLLSLFYSGLLWFVFVLFRLFLVWFWGNVFHCSPGCLWTQLSSCLTLPSSLHPYLHAFYSPYPFGLLGTGLISLFRWLCFWGRSSNLPSPHFTLSFRSDTHLSPPLVEGKLLKRSWLTHLSSLSLGV